MNFPNLNDSLFQESAKTYFIQSGDVVVDSKGISERVGNTRTRRYPIKNGYDVLDGVYLTYNQAKIWKAIYGYLPNGSYISNAYVPPEVQAKVGLKLFEDNYPDLPITVLMKDETNPELIGKYKRYNLFEIDYDILKNMLSGKNIQWSRPNSSIHQRGLAFDISFNSEHYEIVLEIIKWFHQNNSELGMSGVFIKQSETEIHVELLSNDVAEVNIGNTYLMSSDISATVSEALKGKDARFYEILKRNGHVDLIESGIGRNSLARLPNSVKHQNSTLARAIREMIEDSMAGSSGIISTAVQPQLEYLSGLVNGLLGAVSVLGDELDRLTSGRASGLVKQAIESEIDKTCDSKILRKRLDEFQPLTSSDIGAMRAQDSIPTKIMNAKKRGNRIKLTNEHNGLMNKDTKRTAGNNEPSYDTLRVTSEQSIVNLEYDHFTQVASEVPNITVVGKISYETMVNKVTKITINHGLNSLNVRPYAKDNAGNYVVFSIGDMDKNSVSISFNNEFSGTIEVH